MRICLPIIFILLLYCCANAQKIKVPSYFYTQTSEKYLTDKEVDSSLRAFTRNVFTNNDVPGQLFEKYYEKIKPRLILLSQPKMVKVFKDFEKRPGKREKILPGTEQFNAIKKEYLDLLYEVIIYTFDQNPALSQYLFSTNSDRISSFHSTVRIAPDGKLLVTERIRIFNGNGSYHPVYGRDSLLQEMGMMNDEIKRGIVRAFPLYYINRHKLFQNTTFNVKEVLRNGVKEEYHTEKKENGILLFTGNKNKLLPNGYYTYSITYETDHQLIKPTMASPKEFSARGRA